MNDIELKAGAGPLLARSPGGAEHDSGTCDPGTPISVGAQPSHAASAERCPNKSQMLDAAYAEYCRLQGNGQLPDADAFCARYPTILTSLRRLLEAHHFFEENSHLLAAFRPVQWPEPGTTFLGFSLLRELGRGAFARVFLANEPALGNRHVVVKISLQGGTEAETLGRLEHPHIVPVHSVQTEEPSGLFVVCMPYLGRATLCDVLDHAFAAKSLPVEASVILEPLQEADAAGPPGQRHAIPAILRQGTYVDGVLFLGLQLAEALAFIHARGICHRDLKPSNVLLAANGQAMLLDFNLSADEKGADQPLGGTLPYMSPEQLLATALDRSQDATLMDARSDLFSLGVMLYELLSGRHPFGPVPLKTTSQELRKLLLARQQAGCASLRQLNRHVGRRVARLIERCLAYNPSNRPASAAKLAAKLRKSLSWPRRLGRRLARRWRSVAALAAVAVTSVGIGLYCLLPEGTYSERQIRAGTNAYHQGLYAEALRHFNNAIEAEPALARGYYLRGRAYLKMGSNQAALEQFQESARRQRHGPTLACLAVCVCLRGDIHWQDQAIQLNREAIEAGFGPAAVYSNMGYCYLMSLQYDRALETFDQAIRLDDRLQTAYHLRARVDRQRMNMKPPGAAYIPLQGIGDIRKALQVGPGYTELYQDAAYLYGFAARSDPQWTEPARKYFRLALQQGLDLKEIQGNSVLRDLAKEECFQDLIKLPRLANRSRTLARLLDPVDDISQ